VDLYAIDDDPYEQENLADQAQHQELVAELKARCLDWWKETGGKELPTP